jgi:hypothetical protein
MNIANHRRKDDKSLMSQVFAWPSFGSRFLDRLCVGELFILSSSGRSGWRNGVRSLILSFNVEGYKRIVWRGP